MEQFLLKHLPGLSSVGPWLSKKGVIYASIVGFVFACLLITLHCIPSTPEDPKTTNIPYWQISYLIGFPLLSIIIWFISTQFYLRTGKGTKIGLAYDGHAVEINDWKRTRNTLSELLRNGKIKNLVSLRFVPSIVANSEQKANKYMKKYGFTILTAIQQSPIFRANSSENNQNPMHYNINLRIVTKGKAEQFLKATLQHYLEILKKRKVGDSLIEVLDAQAHNLHDMMLLFVASHLFLSKEYKDASEILTYLDGFLSSIISQNESPRTKIRWLDINCRLRRTEFSPLQIPPPEELDEIHKFAETALCYFDESPSVPIAIARIRFFMGDINGAIEITNRYRQKIEGLRKAGVKISDKAQVTSNLNFAFLSFIQGHWENAYKAYCDMLSVDGYRYENWERIIDFIDYVADLEQYEGISYLQTLYRMIAGKKVPNDLRKVAEEWLKKDESRIKLGYLLSRNYHSLLKNTAVKKPKAKMAGRKTKQRSKRKQKGRKKRGK